MQEKTFHNASPDRLLDTGVIGAGRPVCVAGRLERLGQKREIRVEVLHPENGTAVASPGFLCRGRHSVEP